MRPLSWSSGPQRAGLLFWFCLCLHLPLFFVFICVCMSVCVCTLSSQLFSGHSITSPHWHKAVHANKNLAATFKRCCCHCSLTSLLQVNVSSDVPTDDNPRCPCVSLSLSGGRWIRRGSCVSAEVSSSRQNEADARLASTRPASRPGSHLSRLLTSAVLRSHAVPPRPGTNQHRGQRM